ncbi:DUF7716 domain-containing protein [Pseudomonas sichuanensis]|uniref:DUF7716 domain-containing protein n=1 Tax=Pseudomonas sichuanensis TaxID=2213015 RepID=UPI00215F8F1D|nr:hypothetical protein [Pseudomonas sichuanensis]UVL88583.1 hypothetical protein LOY51_22915 [Pseudomonas sichuanensis]
MRKFELNEVYRLEDLIGLVKNRADRDYIYAIYNKLGVENLALGQDIFVGETPSYDDDDNEVLPKKVQDADYEFCYIRDHFQDVIDLAVSQDPKVSDEALVRCLNYYADYDDFLDVVP